MNNTITQRERDTIRTVADRVRTDMKNSTSSWLNICSEFNTAKSQLSQLGFESFINEVGVTKAVGDKLVTVAKCKTLYIESNLETVSTADGWTVLYALAVLEETTITALLKTVRDENKKLTRDVIANFVAKAPLDQKRLVVLSVEIGESDLDTLSKEQLASVRNEIAAVQRKIDALNAGFLFRERKTAIKTITERATANSAPVLVSAAA